MPPETENTPASFEEALARLEAIVKEMEQGDLPLEDSLRLFEEGVRLSQWCHQKLEEAQGRVEILLKERGETVIRPFSPETPPPSSNEPLDR